MLALKNIVKKYGAGETEVLALKGVSLEFRKSEFVSILGPSGCGKTTLLNIIGGLDRYTEGDLIIRGKSTKDYDDKDWDAYRSNSIGFVFQSYNLIPHQTVLGNVEVALTISGISKNERKLRAKAVLEKVGLSDQLHKLPNQLSGGQMQRVAIARALVNNPEIILADEPTGALDTETSIQIMDLLKEVAKDRLVIMVTHNPDLAKEYSTRIIKLIDGKVVDDTMPFENDKEQEPKKMRKPKMKFKTALSLSIRNLLTKKGRTALTSFAGSIGIIGIALVLALSNGFSIYITKLQTDTMSVYPLSISATSVDLTSLNQIYEEDVKEKYPSLDNVFVRKMFNALTGVLQPNILDNSNGFIDYLEADKAKEHYYTLKYSYGFDMTQYIYTDMDITATVYDQNGSPRNQSVQGSFPIDTVASKLESMFTGDLNEAFGGSMSTSTIRSYVAMLTEMPDSADLIKSQYDCIYGDYPDLNNKNEIALVVNEYNEINDVTLSLLGFLPATINGTEFEFDYQNFDSSFETLTKKEFRFYTNKNKYNKSYDGKELWERNIPDDESEEKYEKLKITGVLRLNKGTENGVLNVGIAYSPALTKHLISENQKSFSEIQDLFVEGLVPVRYLSSTYQEVVQENPVSLATNDKATSISIYAKNYDSKEAIKKYIEDWNDKYPDDDPNRIAYSDMMAMAFSTMDTIVNAVSYVLIAFTSISLVVSSVMIGIITYISVVERTKEIGVLRSIGASKRDISNLFNAETFSIGLLSGAIGVGVAYLISIPVNILLRSLITGVGNLMLLNPIAALILVVISVTLTLIAGLIPSRVAAKKDPVIALRTE